VISLTSPCWPITSRTLNRSALFHDCFQWRCQYHCEKKIKCAWCSRCYLRIMWSGGFVCFILSACVRDYCNSNQPISLKPGAKIEPTNRKNWLTFGDDPVQDTDPGSLFHFPHLYEIGDFRRFISISYTLTRRLSRHSAMTDAECTTFWERSGRHRDPN